ncbi:proteoglycan 4 [Drosophila novamexicana]|uniref:proteoglycan 4 n=1 Tax=Drosophila novamexicana TaxID=47314 RepID=UPI0011E5BE54|nr:proteoglycan 4 [Drosophila novamexicana]
MKRAKRWLFMTATVLLLGLIGSADAALPFKKVSIAKTPASTTSTSTTTTESSEPATEKQELPQPTGEGEESKSDNVTLSKNSKLTGIPQIDYIWDPNLPRELRGYNLSSYPFLSTVPPMDEIHFKCEGLHDGFYASIEYKCQIYHHCVYGIRHDFLCANFTAFDQRTFICHFASDVDCEGSQKYWNRNDELYMATTTSSTSTTTTEPPPTPPRRRAQRPYHRPYNRRPVDDYYYDESEDEYYEERYSRRNPRPRPRKPQLQLDYDDEYEDKQVAEKPLRRNRNRYRDEDELVDEDYDDRRNRPGGRRSKPQPAAGGRGKASPRKPGRVEERRSFNEERVADEPRRAGGRRRSSEKRTTPSTVAVLDELDEYEKPDGLDQEEAAEEQTPQKVKTTPKPLTEFITPKAAAASVYARPRAPPRIARPVPVNEKKKYSYPVQKNTATTHAPAGGEQEDDDYYQDREQQEEDYEQPAQPARNAPRRRTAAPKEQKPTRSTLRKPVTEKKALLDEEDDYEAERQETPRRKRPQASRARAPAADVDFVDDVDYEERPAPARAQRVRPKPAAPVPRKPAARPRQPIVQEDEEEHVEPASEEQPAQPRVPPARTKSNSLVGITPARRNQKLALANRQRALPTSRTTAAPALEEELPEEEALQPEHAEPDEVDEPLAPAAPAKPLRPASVRVVKRPFLPSRGGSPYLPRGLQPVGVAVRSQLTSNTRTTDSTPIDMGSTISGVRLLEHGAPLLRGEQPSSDSDGDSEADSDELPAPSPNPPRTTLPPRSALPTSVTPRRPEPQPVKLNLDELYENDYDVTLNDALDPTLKPLTPLHPHQHQHANYQSRAYASAYVAPAASGAYNPFAGHGNSNYQQQASIYQNHSPSSSHASASQSQPQSQSHSPPNYHSDSYFSSTDIRRRAIVPAQVSRAHRHEYAAGGAVSSTQTGARLAQHYYDEFAY